MTRDKSIFLVVLILFVSVNISLLVNEDLPMDWEGLGVVVAAGLTLALYSFLYKDNPFFKMAEYLFVGVAAAYVFGQYWYPTIYGEIWVRLSGLSKGPGVSGDAWLLAPTLLGLLMLTRFSRRFSWLSRLSFAFFVGLGAGLTIPRTISSFILAQIEATIQPLSWSLAGFNLLVILVGVVSVLIYFFFSMEHKGGVGKVSMIRYCLLMISLGLLGYTIRLDYP